MRTAQTLLIAIALALPVGAQLASKAQVTSYPPALKLQDESHHKLVFENDSIRVYRLNLKPGEATSFHQHKHVYAYLSLHPLAIANEVRGRQPIVSTLEPGEIRTSNGGFTLAERNKSPEDSEILVIETLSGGAGFSTPVVSFRYHDAAFGPLFDLPTMRAYEATMAIEGRTEPHQELYDRLLVALVDLRLRDVVTGQSAMEFEMKAGEFRWFPHGPAHTTTNVGSAIAKFITFEFN